MSLLTFSPFTLKEKSGIRDASNLRISLLFMMMSGTAQESKNKIYENSGRKSTRKCSKTANEGLLHLVFCNMPSYNLCSFYFKDNKAFYPF